MTRAPLIGGIIAAGDGSRLRQDGFHMPKALVPIAGVALLERALGNLLAVGVTAPVVIVNESARECVDWARDRFPHVDIEFIVKTTASSFESFLEVSRRLPRGRALISTVDAWCRPDDFVRFVDAAGRRSASATVLAVTPFVADERPLWVDVDGDGRVRRLGQRSGLVTAGIYMVSERARTVPVPAVARLRDFLGWLVEEGEPVYAEAIETVVDVDRASDVVLATNFERGAYDHVSRGGAA
jgi:NDP-sugar pyrophosphorylase family protein